MQVQRQRLRSPRPCFCNKQPRRRQSSFPLPPSFFSFFRPPRCPLRRRRPRNRLCSAADGRTDDAPSSPLESASSEWHRHQQPACCAADRQRRRDGRGRERGREEGRAISTTADAEARKGEARPPARARPRPLAGGHHTDRARPLHPRFTLPLSPFCITHAALAWAPYLTPLWRRAEGRVPFLFLSRSSSASAK